MGGSGSKTKWTNYVKGPSRDALNQWMSLSGAVPHIYSDIHWFDETWSTRAFGKSLQWNVYGKDLRLWIHRTLPETAHVEKVQARVKAMALKNQKFSDEHSAKIDVSRMNATSNSSTSTTSTSNSSNGNQKAAIDAAAAIAAIPSSSSSSSSSTSSPSAAAATSLSALNALSQEAGASSLGGSTALSTSLSTSPDSSVLPTLSATERCFATLDSVSLSIVERLTLATTEIERTENRVYLKKIESDPTLQYHETIIEVDWNHTKSVSWSFQANDMVRFQICTACAKQGYNTGDQATSISTTSNSSSSSAAIVPSTSSASASASVSASASASASESSSSAASVASVVSSTSALVKVNSNSNDLSKAAEAEQKQMKKKEIPVLVSVSNHSLDEVLPAPLDSYSILTEVATTDSGCIDWPSERPRTRGLVALRWYMVDSQDPIEKNNQNANNFLSEILLANVRSTCVDYRFERHPWIATNGGVLKNQGIDASGNLFTATPPGSLHQHPGKVLVPPASSE